MADEDNADKEVIKDTKESSEGVIEEVEEALSTDSMGSEEQEVASQDSIETLELDADVAHVADNEESPAELEAAPVLDENDLADDPSVKALLEDDTGLGGSHVQEAMVSEASSADAEVTPASEKEEASPASNEAQAVIALKADSKIYIYGEPEDPMLGVTQNIDRARELMLETMAKSRATTTDSLQKARNLNLVSGLFLCSALLASVGFFVFMSIQMSGKITEIDSLLTAVAKRSIQMTKGLEKFALIENHLEKTLENQGLINEQLAKDDPFREQINARIEELRVQLKKDMSARVKRSEVNLSEALEEVASSSSNSERAIKQVASIVKSQGNSANSLQELKGSLRKVQKKLDDLYLIEQARVSQEISFQRSNDVDFEPGGGLD